MRPIQDNSGSVDLRQAFIEDRDIGDGYQNVGKDLIRQANTINMQQVFQAYQIKLDEHNRNPKCNCPFPHHQDETPSFTFYKQTNSWFCFGCGEGGRAVEFVALIEGISKEEAAGKLRGEFTLGEIELTQHPSFAIERQNLIVAFSRSIREFLVEHEKNPAALPYAEKITLVYDTLMNKHQLDNAGIKVLTNKLLAKLKEFR